MEESVTEATVTYGGHRKLRWSLKVLRQFSTDLRWKQSKTGATVNYGIHRNLRWTLYKNAF
ncbi:hypothetical protein Hdeb2414_s0262g00851291 [Helianthus debilis subsp. tardiflorus]